MHSFIAALCFLAASASGALLGVPHVTTTQYHSQDDLGQYSYGYSGGPSAKQETRTADGITRGSYSYVDANGIVQSAFYVSDPVNGFRVSATNLPQAPAAPPVVATFTASPGFDHVNGVPFETPEVIAAKNAHFAAHSEALARLGRRYRRSLAPVAYSSPDSTTVVSGPNGRSFSYSTVASAPASSSVIVAPTGRSLLSSPIVAVGVPLGPQYLVQNDLGTYSYGYSDGLSSKTESRSSDGVTHGEYSYLDSNGIVQKVNYVADAGGFRVQATNLPVGPR